MFNLLKIGTTILLCLVVNIQISAQEVPGVPSEEPAKINVEQAVDIALANSIEIKIALLNLAKADKDVANAWAEVLPTVEGNFSYQRNFNVPVSFLPAILIDPTADPNDLVPVRFGTDNNWRTGITVDQNIFRGEAIVGISSAQVFKLVQEESFRQQAQQTVTDVRVAFHRVLLQKELFQVQQNNVTRLNRSLETTRAQYLGGVVDEFSVLQLEVELRNAEPLLLSARNDVTNAYRNLRVLMGMPSAFDFIVEGNLLLLNGDSEEQPGNASLLALSNATTFIPDLLTNPVQWETLRGDLRVLKAQTDLKDRELLALKSRFLPTISANYDYTWTATDPGSPNFSAILQSNRQRANQQVLGITASMTFFDGLSRNAAVQKARIERKELEEQQKLASLNAFNQIERSIDVVNQSMELIPAFQRGIEVAERGYKIAQKSFDNGLATQIDVLNALNTLRQAEGNLAQAVSDYLNAKANYDLALGMVPKIDNKLSSTLSNLQQ